MPKRKNIKTDKPYRLRQKRGVWYYEDKATRKFTSLKFQGTREEADKLAEIEFNLTDDNNAAFHLKSAEAHLAKCNPDWLKNTWQTAFDKYRNGPNLKTGRPRKAAANMNLDCFWNAKALDAIKNVRLIDTTPSLLCKVAKSLNKHNGINLRTLHSYAFNYQMMPYKIMGDGMWPIYETKTPMSRAIQLTEHETILKAMGDLEVPIWWRVEGYKGKTKAEYAREWKDYLNLLWFTGCAQVDGANMTAEHINWKKGCLEFTRAKWMKPEAMKPVKVAIGPEFRALLKTLPKTGPLFPTINKLTTSNRSRLFKWFVDYCKLPKVSLHGYRYAMAERMEEAGMSQNDRQLVLGHQTPTMMQSYAKDSDYVPQSIEVIDGLKAA